MLSLNEAQIDFILTCYSLDHPKEFKFVPARVLAEQMAEQTANVSWANVLIGKTRDEFMALKHFVLPERFRTTGQVKRFPAAPPPRVLPPERPSTRIKR